MVLNQYAIEAALNSDWKTAVDLNLQILKEDPKCIDALNRLGFAYINLGKIARAKSCFSKVLKVDHYNPIALKNLKKIKNVSGKSSSGCNKISPKVFLEESGLTKIVSLVHLADKSVLISLQCGQPVIFITKKNRIEIRSEDNIYLGALPDDLSFRLKKLLKLGNTYCAFIKEVEDQALLIIIRETKRGKRVKDASFITKLIPQYHSSIRSELLEELIDKEVDTSSFEAKEEGGDKEDDE